MKSTVCVVASCLMVVVLLAAPRQVVAESSVFTEGGMGIASVACTFVWGSAKSLFAVGGGATAGLAYLFTGFNSRAARPILQAALRGDYVVTPEHLRGEKALTFIGRDPQYDPYSYR